jgi:hypothetical protein
VSGACSPRGRQRSSPTELSATSQVDGLTAAATGEQLLLLVRRRGRDGEHVARTVDQRDAGVERAPRGSGDGRHPGAGLDRRRELLEAAGVGVALT